jgi:hypothetical protein
MIRRFFAWLLAPLRRWRGSPAMYWKQGGSYIERATVLTDDDKLRSAVQSHIDAGRTREARMILQMIDTPFAREWLARLDSEGINHDN